MSDFKGFGILRVFAGSLSVLSQWRMISGGGIQCFTGLVDPLPTILRDVSGNSSTMATRHDPETMHRNQNIQVQPANAVRLPPSTGPILGAVVTLRSKY